MPASEDGVSSPNRRRRRFRQPEVQNLARVDELFHRAHGLFNRRLGIDPVLIIQINDIDPQTIEADFATFLDVGCIAKHAEL